jgi:hypothetical protein
MSRVQRFLVFYSGALTAVFVATVLYAAAPRVKTFDEINVQRINIVEPDGTPRLVISNHARLPGVLVQGQEKRLERPQAGLLFLNDEGSEIGGLIFGGRKNEKGEIRDSGGSLSFDRYGANQIVQLLGVDDQEDKIVGLAVSDSPSGTEVNRRIWLGHGKDGAATLALHDAAGHKRLIMQVAADGKTRITVLDANGKPVKELLPGGTP